MPHPKPGDFGVYTTVPVDLDVLIQTLNEGQFGNPPSQTQFAASPDSFLNQPVSAIVNHHRTSSGVFNKQYLIIADRTEWVGSGILAVNLDFDGFVDATRMAAGLAGDAIPSVSILNSEWYEILGTRGNGMYPKDRFAVYASQTITRQPEGEQKLLAALNAGLESRKDYSVPVCRLAAPAPVAVSAGLDQTAVENVVSSIAKEHTQLARNEGFHQGTFILADETDWEDGGVLVVRVANDGTLVDQCRRPINLAAEILTWVHLGLYTWEEVKAWDDEKHEMED